MVHICKTGISCCSLTKYQSQGYAWFGSLDRGSDILRINILFVACLCLVVRVLCDFVLCFGGDDVLFVPGPMTKLTKLTS